ncbi:NADH dehydrogenase subunit 5 (mitochondrion) [Diaphorina citri]|uniref:NADH:ubiquinone reductase (H(+)-translocating) n=1 Tax=Diaphorina citri TaxID=121845 RepID=A0A343LDR8_DIACI|nr:NADH dehydrogenase subunit 5 [Diaphorina citri]ANC65507.1 NADH dehydrogenase subunit 5 [Diaphorina citri]ATN42493.1 NADH deshydrogenase subunit 5 [Diaphorina citri]AVT43957.1 NADH dehydrogenase subunit 5 [Diaphorina citri]UUF92076.1 NADH dehydrogenase subunit 5 [Diaphorina citri]UUF92089.1 NADH dehydrogenase subunit 5 [Diaphorina citri]
MQKSKFHFTFFLMTLVYVFLFFLVVYNFGLMKLILIEMELMMINSVSFTYIVYVDWVSLLFSVIVMMISSLIIVYSKIYMGKECYRFFWLMFLFIVFMLIMIFSPSIVGVLLGWDGLGIISYCLVIYYQNTDAYNSGFITAASNRLGDSMLILAVVWSSMGGNFMFWEMNSGLMFFILACMTKSAQFPFSAWLPAAMAAPTPISSLVHSSTLVTAGVYMMIRFFNTLMLGSLNMLLMIISMVTIFIAGFGALEEYDMKRLIALSTLGQLGFMLFILSLGHFDVAFFHLLVHALFKALLFMCAGFVIHSGMGVQDLRKMGSLGSDFVVVICFNISVFSLMGVPFTSGFYSKDSILELTSCSYGGVGLGVFILIMALITVTYSMRLILYLSSYSGWILWVAGSKNLCLSILTLALINIFLGSVMSWMLCELNLISLSFFVKITPIFIVILGCIWKGDLILGVKLKFLLATLFFLSSLTKKMGLISQKELVSMMLLDQGWCEGLMSNSKNISLVFSKWLKSMSSQNPVILLLGVTIIIISVV